MLACAADAHLADMRRRGDEKGEIWRLPHVVCEAPPARASCTAPARCGFPMLCARHPRRARVARCGFALWWTFWELGDARVLRGVLRGVLRVLSVAVLFSRREKQVVACYTAYLDNESSYEAGSLWLHSRITPHLFLLTV